MKIKRVIRRVALILMIALACVLPVPLTFAKKDDLPKFLIEKVELEEEREDDEEIALF
ncbi:MAG: hypothetical protein KJP09_04015 [Bacteroidia bacterium]|nr:hypothetical protein [Bacteroidia bacterium]MBT8310469.1 hypothetical protein [Bacteroidia bacterium]NND12061.1 hypothetical protein [Flavobacteriaceae bacterium]NNK27916.1 hypothetical protein [Flavobacteriaceae bacterium]NNL60562.1 hypothetical protein [Flavobacteriaceae bacterium]